MIAMMVDHLGEVVDGDEILYLLATEAKQRGYTGGVVGTLMSNLGLEQALERLDVPFKRANVGDRYVMELLHDTGWRIGGENSGHILNLDNAATGDAIVASLQVLTFLVSQQQPLHLLKQGMKKMPQVLINVKLDNQKADTILESPLLIETRQLVEKELCTRGRLLLRKSGTEPLVRVMVEADCKDFANEMALKLAACL